MIKCSKYRTAPAHGAPHLFHHLVGSHSCPPCYLGRHPTTTTTTAVRIFPTTRTSSWPGLQGRSKCKVGMGCQCFLASWENLQNLSYEDNCWLCRVLLCCVTYPFNVSIIVNQVCQYRYNPSTQVREMGRDPSVLLSMCLLCYVAHT